MEDSLLGVLHFFLNEETRKILCMGLSGSNSLFLGYLYNDWFPTRPVSIAMGIYAIIYCIFTFLAVGYHRKTVKVSF